jgi:predicted DNA-binding transcriptional regulator YafY
MATGIPARRDKQIIRVLTLLRTLKEGGRPTVHTLAARFHTRRETIYRDLKVLQQAGYPVTGDSAGCLSRPTLPADFRATSLPLAFTKQELAALTWATKQAGSRQPFRGGIEGALLKLQGMAAGPDTRLARELTSVFDGWSRGVKDYTAHQDLILQLVEAIVATRRCFVQYQAPGRAAPKSFRFEPYRLLAIQDLLYCVGKGTYHDALMSLAIDRFQAVTITEEPFTVDPKFDLKQYKAEAFGVVWGTPMTVVLRFRSDQAPYVREREWHPTQRLRDLRDGRLELTFHAGGTFEITRWILGWGDAVEVVRPATLRREVAAILATAANQYR